MGKDPGNDLRLGFKNMFHFSNEFLYAGLHPGWFYIWVRKLFPANIDKISTLEEFRE